MIEKIGNSCCRSINIRGRLMDFSRPWVMAIVNVTPDSFYAGSRVFDTDALRRRIDQVREQGADAVDLGGYSTRPGAPEVSAEEEYRRLALGLECLRSEWPEAVVSIDTFRAGVARRCVAEWGADIINDISGGDMDSAMFETVAELKVPYILMHTRGTPETMQDMCRYEDVTAEVLSDLAHKAGRLRSMGVCDIIIDPGFGFAKDLPQNYELLSSLAEFRALDMPLLVGVSRKSMIYRLLDITPGESLNGTTVLNTFALLNGADILRVHDVAEARQAVEITGRLKKQML